MAFLNKALTISLVDERDVAPGHAPESAADPQPETGAPSVPEEADEAGPSKRSVTYCYDNGLVDYIQHLNTAKRSDVVHPEIISVESEDEERRISLEVAMQRSEEHTSELQSR